jgi:DNA-binding MarR family transcriptional regulator
MSSRLDRRRQAMDQVMEVFGRLRVLVDTGTERRGLTHARAAVLMALHRDGSLTGVDLAKRFKVTPRNVTALVDALESQGLVTRQPHPLDRRAQLVAPTRAGHSMAVGMQGGYERMTEAMLAGFADHELADLERVVGRLADALDGYQRRSGLG